MFYLTTCSTHLWLYGVGHMVKDHSDIERGSLLLPLHGLLFLISWKAYTTDFVTPVVEHCLECEIAQWVHHEESIQRPIAP